MPLDNVHQDPNWTDIKYSAQNSRDAVIFTYLRKSSIIQHSTTLYRNLVQFLGVTSSNFPTLRIVRMNNHHFFGSKYKMDKEVLKRGQILSFIQSLGERKLTSYKKSQDYNLIKEENERNSSEIKQFKKMYSIHQKNFKSFIENHQKQYGYILFVYGNIETCPNCELLQSNMFEAFDKALVSVVARLENDLNQSPSSSNQKNIDGMKSTFKLITDKFVLTKINAQQDELTDWVFEMVPEMVMVYPGGVKIETFDHFEDKLNLQRAIETFITRVYFGVASGSYPQYSQMENGDSDL